MDPMAYYNMPAAASPSGVYNFDHPVSRAWQAHIAMGVCISLTGICILMRLYIKVFVTQQWGLDDVSVVVGWLAIIAHDSILFTIMGPGKWLGIHMWDIRVMTLGKSYIQRALVGINLYAVSAFFVKFSLFLLYLRLFKPNRTTCWLIYIGIAVCALFYTASIATNCILFMPLPGQPNNDLTWLTRSGKSSNPTLHLAVVQGVFGTLSDIYLLVIPIQSISQLQMPLSRKLGISAVFFTGIIAIACSLASLVYRVKLLTTTDSTWLSLSVWILSAAEISAGIICSCLPIFSPLFRSATSKMFRFPSSLRYLSRFSGSTNRPGIESKSAGSSGFKNQESRTSKSITSSSATRLNSRSADQDRLYIELGDVPECYTGRQ